MIRQKLLGHLLLWLGFLGAVLATVSQKELDLLSASEQQTLNGLESSLKIGKADLLKLSTQPLAEQSEAELRSSVEKINQWHQANQDRLNEMKAENLPPPPLIHPQTKLNVISLRTAKLDNLWSTVRWPWYGLGMLVALAGVVLLRASRSRVRQDVERSQGQLSNLYQALNTLLEKLQTLEQDFVSLIPEQVVEFIDDQCVTHFNDFADARDSLIQSYGLTAFAEIMGEFATGERYINRAWSAAADGYLEEAKRSIARSRQQLLTAKQMLDRYEQASPGRPRQ